MAAAERDGFMDTLLKPGSSLHPAFLNILDGVFVGLLLVFIMLAIITSGNPHIFALMFIELGLWASVKWFVHELKMDRGGAGSDGKKDQ